MVASQSSPSFCFTTVKEKTKDGIIARFPDAVTVRGKKHLYSLMNAVFSGYEACMLYIIQRSDCNAFAPAKEIDPQYAKTLKLAVQKGVKVIVCTLKVTTKRICLANKISLNDID